MQTLTFSRPASNIDSDNYRMNIHRGKYNKDRKYLGSLYLDYSMQDKNDAIFEKCSPQEMIQLKEYVLLIMVVHIIKKKKKKNVQH